MNTKTILITGIRGIPAAHGGFETFAEKLALYLNKRRWQVIVYCQENQEEQPFRFESEWNGIHLIHIPVKGENARASILFDYLSIRDAAKKNGLILTLGYNTACFNLLLRLRGKRILFNMDGIEWKRKKWAWYEKVWLFLNERLGSYIGNHLIADHPEIERHLCSHVSPKKVSMIPYGAREVSDADYGLVTQYDFRRKEYAIVVARPEPENNILEIVRAFSSKPRRKKLLIIGNYTSKNSYQQQVMAAASKEVKFIGAVYDHEILDALRYYSCLYIHGHTVGGTNPSLVEALGSGQPILAHDNVYNRWVAGDRSVYFKDQSECERQLDNLLSNVKQQLIMSQASKKQFSEKFTWDDVLGQYEKLLSKWVH